MPFPLEEVTIYVKYFTRLWEWTQVTEKRTLEWATSCRVPMTC
jgi:hypothetical protein